ASPIAYYSSDSISFIHRVAKRAFRVGTCILFLAYGAGSATPSSFASRAFTTFQDVPFMFQRLIKLIPTFLTSLLAMHQRLMNLLEILHLQNPDSTTRRSQSAVGGRVRQDLRDITAKSEGYFVAHLFVETRYILTFY
ncbi:hypothetical protein KI387_001659, partial [Taxus chinensis]